MLIYLQYRILIVGDDGGQPSDVRGKVRCKSGAVPQL